MISYPNIKPYIVKIGPFEVRWYGLMYLFGFITSYILVRYQIKKRKLPLSTKIIDEIYFYLILGLIIGARLGYVIFYNLGEYIKNPLEIFAVWHGGMSFHGGLIGALLAGVYVTKRYKLDFWLYSDLIIVTAPIGLGLGRIGNFINGELYGRVTTLPWGMVFPAGGPLPRHPSQLYEAFFEGLVLFLILWYMKDRVTKKGRLTAAFLLFYGIFRFFIEFFREPDPQLGFIIGPFTMGQILCIGMIIVGSFIWRVSGNSKI
jgi:phosphatidylglycerol:prolipoprotein diacylglycerol transferase